MSRKPTIVHVTHEAIGKIGGIGAVLEGFFTSDAYLAATARTILISPLFTTEGSVSDRLGPDGEVFYSSIDGLMHKSYLPSFRKIEEAFNVGIVYGRRRFLDEQTGVKSSPEVVLIDITRIDPEPVNRLKCKLYDEFGIRSHLYEHLWEYEQYVRLAPAAIAVLKALGGAPDKSGDYPTIIVAHEFMGMPTALAGMLDGDYRFKTVFYAHEVATMRPIVEEHPGKDTMFYNVIKQARANKVYVNDVFGDQSRFFKHVLVEASKHCDNILAVGDYVVDELRFLGPEFETADIDLVYNGIPAYRTSLDEKLQSKAKLRRYCLNLLDYEPDFIFTHVTRMTPSKGLWRDLHVLEHLEREFRKQNKTAVVFILSTEVASRRSRDIDNMQSQYDWPVAHREGMPDMSGGEARFYTGVQRFNAKSRNIKIVFVNQFGFDRSVCGGKMPEDIEFLDIRRGSDVEFGQSVYEPFGIAQLEPLTFGGICVVSSVCGCAGLVRDVAAGRDIKNVIIADYTDLGPNQNCDHSDIEELLQLDQHKRTQIEHAVSEKVARQICNRLPANNVELEQMIRTGYELAKHMSWDAVVKNYLLKSLEKAIYKNPSHRGIYLRA